MKYFIAVDFYSMNINKFYTGIVTFDLNKDDLQDVARQIIKDNFSELDLDDMTVKITAFNNITT